MTNSKWFTWKISKVLMVLTLFLSIPSCGYCQEKEKNLGGEGDSVQIKSILDMFSSPEWTERRDAFNDTKKYKLLEKDEIKIGLFNLLEKESDYEFKIPYQEGVTDQEVNFFYDYLEDLKSVVIALKDPRSIRALLLSRYYNSISSFGESYIDTVLGFISSDNLRLRLHATRTISFWARLESEADPQESCTSVGAVHISDDNRDKIKDSLLEIAKHDEHPGVRSSAILGLRSFVSDDVVNALEEIVHNFTDADFTEPNRLPEMTNIALKSIRKRKAELQKQKSAPPESPKINK